MKDRICGNCEHWQQSNTRDKMHGICCKDVPFWAFDTEVVASWFVLRNETRAKECDCYEERLEV